MKEKMDERKKTLETIASYCEENNISQGELSRQTGIRQATLSKWFNKKAVPKMDNCECLMEWMESHMEKDIRKDINTAVIKSKCEEIGLPEAVFCKIIIGNINSIDDIKSKGMASKDVKKASMVLGIEEEDMYIKEESNALSFAEEVLAEEIRVLKMENKKLRELIAENKTTHDRAIAGCNSVICSIIGTLYNELGIKVGKED